MDAVTGNALKETLIGEMWKPAFQACSSKSKPVAFPTPRKERMAAWAGPSSSME
jgi:hypothetical protein